MKCDRCDKKHDYIFTKLMVRVRSGDSTWYDICDECFDNLRFWLYRQDIDV